MLKLWQLLTDLPTSLLLVSLLVTGTALPVNAKLLTPIDFSTTIAEGTWFVEHFSPYCGHCRHFLPTWEKLVEMNEAGEFAGVSLAQVDCAVHGDLCDTNGITGYPQLNLYREGKFVEKYSEPRELDNLVKYLNDNKPQAHTAAGAALVNTKVAPPAPVLNPSGAVLVLDSTNFQDTINAGPAFVKFYAPWCGHCKKLAPTWKSLARHFQSKLTIAEINCEDHPAFCATQGIKNYPTLLYYSAGTKTEYNGGRKLEPLSIFAEKASAPPTKAIKANELGQVAAANSVLYVIICSGEAHLLRSLDTLVRPFLGSPTVVTITDAPQDLKDRFKIPKDAIWAIAALKDGNIEQPTSVHVSRIPNPASDETEIISWLSSNRSPSFAELSQDTFQDIMNSPHRPLVVVAAVNKNNKDKVAERFGDVARKWKVRTGGTGKLADVTGMERSVVFTWMDAEKWKDWMKGMYGIKVTDSGSLDGVEVVIADHKNLVYYDSDQTGEPIKISSSQSLFSAIGGVAAGKIRFKHSENLIERLSRYVSGKLTAFEDTVVNHPIRSVSFLLFAFVVIIWAIRRFVKEDLPYDHEYPKGKVARID